MSHTETPTEIHQHCLEELQRLADANRDMARLLPELARRATLPALRRALEEQHRVHAVQHRSLERIFGLLGAPFAPIRSDVGRSLVEEARTACAADDPTARDAGILAAARRFEAWERGTLAELACWYRELGDDRVVGLLEEMKGRVGACGRYLEALQTGVASAGDLDPVG